jgi:hypothetical protein
LAQFQLLVPTTASHLVFLIYSVYWREWASFVRGVHQLLGFPGEILGICVQEGIPQLRRCGRATPLLHRYPQKPPATYASPLPIFQYWKNCGRFPHWALLLRAAATGHSGCRLRLRLSGGHAGDGRPGCWALLILIPYQWQYADGRNRNFVRPDEQAIVDFIKAET